MKCGTGKSAGSTIFGLYADTSKQPDVKGKNVKYKMRTKYVDRKEDESN